MKTELEENYLGKNDYYLGTVDNKNKTLHDTCVLWEKTKFGFHNHAQRNGLGFHNFSLVKSRFVKCASKNLEEEENICLFYMTCLGASLTTGVSLEKKSKNLRISRRKNIDQNI